MPVSNQEPLAIVGIGCRLPGKSNDPESFWDLLVRGESAIREVPPDRWDAERYYHPDVSVPIKMITKWGGFVEEVDQFDASFFGISPREAQRIDPQQRWLLEVAWEALEDAAEKPEAWRGSRTGVFVGISSNEYGSIQMMGEADIDVHTNSGSTLSIASNRISYLYDFKGPSMSVDTACSSALVAVNLACKSIWSGDCDAALAGGVNALLMPDSSIGFSKATMLSPSGQCFAFDARANGYVRGEGAGLVVIKSLKRAREDGDRIYALIRSAVVNQDGNTSSMTVPGEDTQAAMLRDAYAQAGMPPNRVTYMEAHGTGTPVGDPIETRALGEVLCEGRAEGEECIIGSVKSNIGHLESGSGIAGLIKAAMVLHKGQIPQNLNYQTPNPNIPFKELKLKVPKENMPLPRQGDLPPVTAVNSFGFGGTNAHIVLEEAPQEVSGGTEANDSPDLKRPFLLPISGNGEIALRKVAESYRAFLSESDDPLGEICFSAGHYRQQMDDRLVVIGEDTRQMRGRLKAWMLNPGEDQGIVSAKSSVANTSPVFVFTGQGAQWWGMGQELLVSEPVFRDMVQRIDDLLIPMAGWSLIEEMNRGEEDSKVDRTDIAQPAIFALQVALAELWKSWGILPAKVIGHSVGEVAAAYVAGIYTLEDAVKVIYHRSRLQNTTGGHGRMVAVGVSRDEARRLISGHEKEIEVAVVNSPGMVTLAGDTGVLEEVVSGIEDSGKFVRWLRIDYAFHTHQMEPIKDELIEVLAGIVPRAALVPFYSTVTAGLLEGEALDGHYWWRNVRESVLFAPAINKIALEGSELFLELGPHPALVNPITECLGDAGKKGVILHSLKRKEEESATILQNLALLYSEGVDIDWAAVNQAGGHRVRLPKYAWNHERFWIECDESHRHRLQKVDHPLLGLRQPSPQPTWEFRLDPREFGYLDDHRFWDSIVFPAAGYAEIGLALTRVLFADEVIAVEDLVTKKALFISEKNVPTVRVVYREEDKSFAVYSTTDEGKNWELNSEGFLRKVEPGVPSAAESIEVIRDRMEKHADHEQYYEEYRDAGYQFGPNFSQVTNIWSRPNESVAEITVPDEVAQTVADYHFQPAVLDACFHALKGAQVIPDGAKASENFFLPAAIRRVHLYRERPPGRFWVHAAITFDDNESVLSDIFVYDEDGERVADILGFRIDRVEQKDEEAEAIENSFYEFRWEAKRLRGSRVSGDPGFEPPEEIAASVNEGLEERYERHKLASYLGDFASRVDSLACRCVEEAYKKLGWSLKVGEDFATGELFESLGIVPEHHRLAVAQLKALVIDGVLENRDDGQWKLVREFAVTDVIDELAGLRADYPEYAADLDLYDMAWPRLAEVLSGDTDPLEVLFPGGSSEKLEAFYIQGADFPANNEMLACAVAKAVEGVSNRRAVRILEVGAGTGSLTRSVLETLPADRIDYTFTDNGPAFISEARKAFADNSSIEFGIFDIEKDPAEQGIDPSGYDLILATNVIHATSELKTTLGQLKNCLAPGGLLMFLEVTRSRNGLDLIFGLLKGWWQYTDMDLRPDSALLNRRQWEDLLADCGYGNVASFVNTPDAEHAGQTAFIAERGAPVEDHTEPPQGDEGARNPDLPTAVIFSDCADFSGQLSTLLEADGKQVVIASSESPPAEVVAGIHTIETIIHACGIEVAPVTSATVPDDLMAAQQKGSMHLLRLSQALASAELEQVPTVYVLGRGVGSIAVDDRISGLASAPAVALLRVARGEHPEFGWRHIDLAEEVTDFDASNVYDEIVLSDEENEVGYREDRRYVNRLYPVKVEDAPNRVQDASCEDGTVLPYRLQIDAPGILTNLSLNQTVRRAPAAGEIEVSVKAGGINFRDVMKALGMYPGNPVDLKWFGDDFSGIVTRVGEGVLDIKEGDAVAGMAPYCFRSYVTVHRHMVFRKAAHQSFQDAATLPTVFLTSHYALNELARMRKGERVLIHAGTGGVGMAAIQIAKRLELEIFATAGTPEKRKLLLELGAHHALSSRTLAFADEIMEITGGEGVDCVLNSLAGDFIPKSFSVLRNFGRFVEIGKMDIYSNAKLGLEQLRNNISYFVVDLAQHLQEKPEYVAEMFSELAENFASQQYKPLPYTGFAVTDVVEAFRYMAQGKHIGKNVLDFECDSIPVSPCTEPGHLFRDDASYLITGGMSGFGFELAKWMCENGARNLVLVSRSGARDEEVASDILQMTSEGITVVDARADVSSGEDISRVIKDIAKDLPPLRGVIHGAMVLDDQFMVDMDDDCFTKVLRPKMLGAWNLHLATRELDLEHFICFSSFSAVIGAVKQANYNAGNYFLDTLASYRQARGLPALTINWGALVGAGFVERNEKTAAYLDKLGMKPYTMADTQEVLSRLLPKSTIRMAASVVDWQQLVKLSPALASSPLYRHVARRKGEGEGGGSIRPQIIAASPEERIKLLEEFIAEQVAGVFGTDVAKIDRDTPLTSIGLDSLMAIELMNRMESSLGINLPMGAVLNGPNIRELAASLLDQVVASDDDSATGSGSSSGAGGSLIRIEKSGIDRDEFPLSEGQKALWFLHQLAPESAAYNLVFSSKLTPAVDINSMSEAFAMLFERHPMLDATFHIVDGEPVQRLHRGRTIDCREHDATGMSEEEIKGLIAKHAERSFDLENGPMVRLELFLTAEGSHIVLLSMHHIVADAWSVSLLMNDLIEGYFSIKSGGRPEYQPLEYRYHDYVDWQHRNLEGAFGAQAAGYWRDQLDDAPHLLDLPTDRPRPPVQTFNGGRLAFELDPNLAERVLEISSEGGATLYSTMLAAYNVLFHLYCGQDDIVVGSPMAGRNQGELGGLIGYFINPVPLRSRVDDDPSFSELMHRTGSGVNSAIEYQDYPLVRIVDDLNVARDPGRSPLFQVSFAMERVPGVDEQGIAVFLIGKGGHQFAVGDMIVETIDLNMRQAQFEITLVVEESGGKIFGCWQYNRDLFDESTINRLNALWARVLEEVSANPDIRISDINLLSGDEMQAVVHDWNATEMQFPQDRGIHTLVSEQAVKTPDATAVVAGGQALTYAQIESHSNAIAAGLISRGVVPDTAVALLVERGGEMISAMLGILKAGAHYIPLDPDYPDYRLKQMLEDALPAMIITTRETYAGIPDGEWSILDIADIADSSDTVELPAFDNDRLAYVIYTSGSTGNPKGVEITQGSAVNFLTSMRRQPGMTRVDRLLALTTLSFDISLLEIFLPLIAGAQVVVATREEARDGRLLARLLDEHSITVMQATPATWRMLFDSGWEGRNGFRILCGGEAMPRDLANLMINSADEVWNLYGPTETTVWSSCSRVTEGDESVSIGAPIANTQIYIVGRNGGIQPPGFVGELCIGGAGLARGYRDRADLNAERFIALEVPGTGPCRVYRTGDLARWGADGKLECLGRMDSQIKLRGVRMELGEIETVLMSHASVSGAVVTKRDDLPGGETLVAYLTCHEGDIDELVPELKTCLEERLPEVMCPGFFEVMDAFPLTPNRKVDRRRLPVPVVDRSLLPNEFAAPETAVEKTLSEIFNAVFTPREVGIRDNFFELGGDSLMAVQVATRISSAMDREISLQAFLRHPTIERLARHIDASVEVSEDDALMPEGKDPDSDYLSFQFLDEDAIDALPRVNAVALAYIPDAFATATGLSREELVDQWFEGHPRLTNSYDTPWGPLGVVMLPCFEADLYREGDHIKPMILDALRLAGSLGAKTVSLTGVIPMVTGDGRDIITWMNGEEVDLPIITTGDATRAATVVKSLEGILEQSGRSLEDERVTFIGLGSIGKGTLDLMLSVLPHPKAITLCDFYRTEERLDTIQDQLLASGYSGEITIAAANEQLPDEAYEAGLLITATSVPEIIDVDRMKPGSLLVDYSFPPSFSVSEAARRATEHGDILFTTGGQLRLDGEVEETVYLPAASAELIDELGSESLKLIAGREGSEMTGCVLAAIFTGMESRVKVTLGALSGEDALEHYRFIQSLGLDSAHLQMGGYFLPAEVIRRFRERPSSERSGVAG
ncbi:MAG: amino acid adenylation domain-containing protein [Verrucomicrobiaceae bacterium]|nr:amino acid adenylation domain-containing protein [Verrucomicrobiaceae bacterium]